MDKEENAQVYRELETAANQFTLKCLMLTVAIMALVWICNILGIFIVDSRLTGIAFGSGICIMTIAVIVCKIVGISQSWVKYFLLFASVLAITVVGTLLSYHAVLISVLPLLYSAQYNRKVVGVVYGMSVISTFVTVMAGYFWGLCDANMLLLTVHTRSYYVKQLLDTVQYNMLNENPWITLPLYYVLPRVMILLCIVPVILHIADGIVRKAEREASLKRLSEIDEMTKMYNRNKYRAMVKDYYPTIPKVGVIFWDVNGLKRINDTKGHEYGDLLIMSVASLVRELVDDTAKAYRIGGDEFVLIMENATEEQLEERVRKWNCRLQKKNESSEFLISAAVGYSTGLGTEIENTVKQADHYMYLRKSNRAHS